MDARQRTRISQVAMVVHDLDASTKMFPDYLDTEPLPKFVLESGSGHAIDLTPSQVYPPARAVKGR